MSDRRLWRIAPRRLEALILACGLFVAQFAWADGGHAMVGAGTAKCSRYLESGSKGFDSSVKIAISWTQGHFSAINVGRMAAKRPTLVLPKFEQIRAWHDSYCKEHPDDPTYESSDSLLESLEAH